MDAPHDRDIELQRASGDLIEEFRCTLPSLLWKHTKDNKRIPHQWAKLLKTEKLILLLEPFQEWPQLLDSHLGWILPHLTDAFLAYLATHRGSYTSKTSIESKEGKLAVFPLPRAICKILYVLCKIRGLKVIIRFLSNEPRFLEPMLTAFIQWSAISPDTPSEIGQGLPLVWEEKYVMLLWLSHLLLAPFDLASISSKDIPVPYDNLSILKDLSPDIPQVALSILSISLKHSFMPGKEREAAVLLLTRLVLRVDMQRLGLLNLLVKWALDSLRPSSEGDDSLVYTYIGRLSFISKLAVLSQVEDISPFVIPIFEQVLLLSQGNSSVSQVVQSSASARKLIIKILREMTSLCLTLEEKSDPILSSEKISTFLEDTVDHCLMAVSDKDTPVRFAASKALSVLTLKLDPDVATDVIDAVIGSLEENVLYENHDGSLISNSEARNSLGGIARRNIGSVDPLKWHGLMLTLGHLLFRRSPPLSRLSQVLQSLLLGLDFEQRSSTGASIGGNVRDASCFGIWSLSRKYTTKELNDVNPSKVKLSAIKSKSILQTLATELICSACLDPAGNIRRGSSAALQELIGRHPDSIPGGISLVQIVDYHAVARRATAMNQVAPDITKLDSVYWEPLLEGLLRWRGIGSHDSKSRRMAALAIGELSLQGPYTNICKVLDSILSGLSTTFRHSTEGRHGSFLALSATIDAYISRRAEGTNSPPDDDTAKAASQKIYQLWEIFNAPLCPSIESLTLAPYQPELTAEACSCFLSSLARSCEFLLHTEDKSSQPAQNLLEKAVETMLLCVRRGNDEPIESTSRAADDLFTLLPADKKLEIAQKWCNDILSNWKKSTGRGQVAALGAVFKHFPVGSSERSYIFNQLVQCTSPDETTILKRVAGVNSITTGVLPASGERAVVLDTIPKSLLTLKVLCAGDTEQIAQQLQNFLADYTTDRRGDIGSLIRLEAIDGVMTILQTKWDSSSQPEYLKNLMKFIVKLSAEKLDKVRFAAWKCLQHFWASVTEFPPLEKNYDHFSDVTTPNYFLQLYELLRVDWCRLPLLEGLATSLSAGTESLIGASRTSLVVYINGTNDRSFRLDLLKDILSILGNNMDNDRYAIPIVDTTAFLLDNCFTTETFVHDTQLLQQIFKLVQKSHFRSSNIPRIEVAIKLYFSLTGFESTSKVALAKLTGLLLHPYPKIRMSAGECLFVATNHEKVRNEDWMKDPKVLKPVVEGLRQVFAN
ncbi:hypothetical protein FQN57_003264 [Myotisia sp. PD_48]|nr:hypothetical protein FQN57_003264 [Myotisia sp. PD_48]